ncbi:M3 family metallopeptidase [Suttonella ornithocola]|uniref:oligopeptidase A n=1 Tax=Suttonella ornithocola TaxID=279832 RepID=A0A380MV03_9GAMM|nr:M3 family metallopeptidase [Suttonella ornithocola]SUO95541.1 Oligopeptidase A [Suttonella ornithocola]
MQTNPLYQPSTTPDFKHLLPEHAEAVLDIIEENRDAIECLVSQPNPTWDSLMQPLARMENRLSLAFSPIAHLHSVMSTDEWRAAYEKLLPDLSAYSTDISQHSDLYEAIKKIKNSEFFSALTPTRQKIIIDHLENFERNGVALPDSDKQKFKELSLRLSELSTAFSNNVLDATNAWHLTLEDDTRLSGLPSSARALMADLAKQHNESGYRITLDAPVVIPVLTYADDQALREQIYRAYNARASELSDDGKFDNAKIIEEILSLREQSAKLLGFKDYATLNTASNKMASNPTIVMDFLENLVHKSKSVGESDILILKDFASNELQIDTLQPWDVGYASEKLRQKKYALSQEDLRPFFPMSKVLEGLFTITEKLFGVTFQQNIDLPVWHNQVTAYNVLNDKNQIQAQFYLDPYARQKKRAGAWMDSAAERFLDDNKLQIPVAYLVCNFTPPVGEEEAYLTHDEVTTLFHEFGHGLHHMLTKVDDYGVSGISGVEWDAVEQPSQFMENFCYDRECLIMMTRHKETNEPLTDVLYQKLIAAKNFQSAMAMLRQLEFALFDFRLHLEEESSSTVLDVLKKVRKEVAVTPEYAQNRFPMQFSHIFAGGYAAGYYSYKWAEVLSADSFSAFEEEGILNAQTGARFRDEILAVGSSRPSMESFIAFRGREPEVTALLKHNGIL